MSDPAVDIFQDWQNEQRRRWEAGDKLWLETFLERHPHVAAHEQHVIDLIYAEFRLRESLGDSPRPREYEERFPSYSSQLKSLFEVHSAKGSVGEHTAQLVLRQALNTVDLPLASGGEDGSDVSPDFTSTTTQGASLGAPSAKGMRFKVLRPHARGGFGEVLLAFDEELHREVALKQIQTRHADHPERRMRFVAEAEITGGLEHPGIVPVYSLGNYRDGRPFYAMRFIRGESLKGAIDRFHEADVGTRDEGARSLDLRKLLLRMISVCDAIEYAHSRGVLHRDLKPANIMVGKYGETLVVDWGLAKVAGSAQSPSLAIERPLELSSRSDSEETRMGSAIGTPQYMSPEQAAGRLDLITTASDVYCLGSTLYHLLVGKPPLHGKDVGQMLQRIQNGDIPRPRSINSLIPRPLEAVCLKAMALEPRERYGSPRLMAEDIEHWMADEPVSAYRERAGERVGRWVRKHRSWALAAGSALVIVAIVSIAAALVVNRAWHNESIERQNAVAAREEAMDGFKRARETVDTWLTGAGEALKYYPSMQQLRKVLLKQAAADYAALAERHADPSLEIERGRAQIRLGDAQRILGDSQASEQAYRQGEQLFDAMVASGQEPAEARVERANARVKRALLLADTDQAEEADAEYATVIAELKQSLQRNATDRRAREALGTALVNRAALLREQREHAKAIETLGQALDEFAAAWADAPQDPRGRFAAATAKSLWGQCLVDAGQYKDAVRKYDSALADLGSLVTEVPGEPEYLESEAVARVGMAAAYRAMGKYAEELDCYRRAVDDYQALDRALPHAPPVIEGLALTRTDMGQLLYHLGETAQAQAELDLALPAFLDLQNTYADVPRYRDEVAANQDTLGEVYRDLGRNDAAKAAHERAVAIYDALQGDAGYQEREAICRSHLGQVLGKLGSREPAVKEFREAIATLDELSAKMPSALDAAGFARIQLGVLLLEMGDNAAAHDAFAQAQSRWETLVAEYPYPEYLNQWAWLLATCPDETLRNGERAVEIAERAVQLAPDNTYYRGTLAAAQYRKGDFARSVAILQEVQRARPQLHGREWFFLAMALEKSGAHAEAVAALTAGEHWMRDRMPGNAELERLRDESSRIVAKP